MVREKKAISDYLDDMAIKILMIEPGDLSQVGALLELLEQFLGSEEIGRMDILHSMGTAVKNVLEKFIMTDLSDTTENYDRLAQCISLMQESVRKNSENDPAMWSAFQTHLAAIGYKVGDRHPPKRAEIYSGETMSKTTSNAEGMATETPVGSETTPSASTACPDFFQDRDLIAGFIAEAFEHLQSIEVNILELEHNPGDLEIINSIFRPFHTIKGVSGFLNLKNINELAHITENLLDDVRNDRFPMDSEIIDVILSVGDFMRAMIQNLKDVLDNGPEQFKHFDISEHVSRVQIIQAARGSGAQQAIAAPQKESLLKKAEETPSSPVTQPEVFKAPVVEENVPVEEPQVPSSQPPLSEPLPPSPKPVSLAPETGTVHGPIVKKGVGESIKVDVDKLDNLVNAVGELVIMQSQVRHNPLVARVADQKLIRDFSQLARITSELQKTAMSMRMVPIRQTFQKMIRLVRDLSKKSGKKAELIMSGEETEIDRNMVDSIYDPLVHMVRNAVDHGVQTPEERRKLGKTEQGTVNLRAYQKGGNIVIEIEDDGHGINRKRVRAKAIERGLIREDEVLSPREIENLIFLPGFSTAEKISDVSGRGVGMDVVKKAVERLRGKVEVNCRPEMGTLFVIRLPLTLAIIDGILVKVGSERFIIPTINIQESIKPTPEMYQTVHGQGEALLIRENLVPIIRLYEVFGVKDSECTDPCEGIVVVIENEGQRRALMVDGLLGKQEVVIKSLGEYMADIKGVAGGTILGDGRVGLILDIAGFFATQEVGQ